MLPFQNLSGDPEQDYFADGMVEDIITALANAAAPGGEAFTAVQRRVLDGLEQLRFIGTDPWRLHGELQHERGDIPVGELCPD